VLAKGFVVFAFLLFSSGIALPLLRLESDAALDVTQGNPIMQAMFAGVYLVTFFLVLMRWKRFVYVATSDKLLLLLVGIVLVSVLWSAAPEITLRRSAALVGTTLFGGYLATRYGLKEQLRLLAWAMGITALLSLLVALALPSYGISDTTSTMGNWQGIFSHKNSLGRSMVLSAMVFFLLAVRSNRHRWLAWAGVGLSCGLLFLSNSITGVLVALILLSLWPFAKALRYHHTIAVPFLITAGLLCGGAAVLLLSNAEPVLTLLGRDVTLTGRTEVWTAVLDISIRERPWLGYGYSAFWLGWEGPSAQIWQVVGEQVVHSHNGVLDLWLNLGLLGVVVFVLGFSRAFIRAMARARYTKTAEDLWPLAFLSFFFFYNTSESMILVQNSIYWVLYVSAVLSVSTQQGRYRNTSRISNISTRASKARMSEKFA
jgi:O-antigen ligase